MQKLIKETVRSFIIMSMLMNLTCADPSSVSQNRVDVDNTTILENFGGFPAVRATETTLEDDPDYANYLRSLHERELHGRRLSTVTMCIKTHDKQHANTGDKIKLIGYHFRKNWRAVCYLEDGIGRDEQKCCVGEKEDTTGGIFDGTFFEEPGKSMSVRLMDNTGDGVYITRASIGNKVWSKFDGSTSGCSNISFDGCIKWDNCSGCNEDDCLRIDEPFFMLDGDASKVPCREAFISNSGVTCCFHND